MAVVGVRRGRRWWWEEEEGAAAEKTRNICTKDPSPLLHGTCALIAEEGLVPDACTEDSMRNGGTPPSVK